MSPETKKKISDTLKSKGIRPKVIMDWTGIKRPSSPLRGRKRLIEVVQKVADGNRGKIVSEETKGKISKTLMGRFVGELNPVWIKDRSLVKGRHQRNYHDNDYKLWRKEVFKRDNWKCKISDESCSGRIEAHHILPWRDYVELRYNINNGITLCHAHHPRKRAEENRLSPYFKSLLGLDKLN